MKSSLKLARSNDDEVSRQDIFLAKIDQEHRESHWTPIDARPVNALPVDEILSKSDAVLEGMVGKQ